jgi:hypothetical protein
MAFVIFLIIAITFLRILVPLLYAFSARRLDSALLHRRNRQEHNRRTVSSEGMARSAAGKQMSQNQQHRDIHRQLRALTTTVAKVIGLRASASAPSADGEGAAAWFV